jgi:hypothetical protein
MVMRKCLICALAGCVSTAAVANVPDVASELTAAQIIEKNVAARGGAEAWRKIQSMVWIGHIDRASAGAPSLPFVLEQKRPNKTRFEIKARDQIGVRIYDGAQGWKQRPASNGKPELQPFTAGELRFARDGLGIDGPLMDYQAKGIVATLDGTDEVEGRKSYRLNVRLPSGAIQHVWIDAQTFLEVKSDRQSRNASGQTGTVSVYYRDYRTMEGLQIPFTIESGAGTGKVTDKMMIDRISLNPPLDDRVFAKPNLPGQRNPASTDTRRAVQPPPSLPLGLARSNPRAVPGLRDSP